MHLRLLILHIILLATVVAVAVAFSMTPIYRAEVLLAPVSDDEQSSMNAIASQFGGIASLVGINTTGGGEADQALATLTSHDFISEFINDHQLMPVLFEKKWNASKKEWNVDDQDDVPTASDAYDLFNKKILDVSVDKKTGFVTLGVEWEDPKLASTGPMIWRLSLIITSSNWLLTMQPNP